jgi:hypothetical protein
MNRIILVGLILLLISIVGCSPVAYEQTQREANTTITAECFSLCTSHANWTYREFRLGGYGPLICVCKDNTGAIWTMPI